MGTRFLQVVVALMVFFGIPASTGAQQSPVSSVLVNQTVVTFTSDWEVFDTRPTGVVVERRTTSLAVFSYLEMPDEMPPVADNVTLIETVAIDFFEEAFGPRSTILWGGGTLTDGTDWQLYAVDADGDQLVLLVTGNTEQVPGVDVLTTLLVDESKVFTHHAAAIADITINDAPIPMAGIAQDVILGVILDPEPADP